MAFRSKRSKGRRSGGFKRGSRSRSTRRSVRRTGQGHTLRIVVEQASPNPLARPEIAGLTQSQGKKSTF